jgi:hypothetical protein
MSQLPELFASRLGPSRCCWRLASGEISCFVYSYIPPFSGWRTVSHISGILLDYAPATAGVDTGGRAWQLTANNAEKRELKVFSSLTTSRTLLVIYFSSQKLLFLSFFYFLIVHGQPYFMEAGVIYIRAPGVFESHQIEQAGSWQWAALLLPACVILRFPRKEITGYSSFLVPCIAAIFVETRKHDVPDGCNFRSSQYAKIHHQKKPPTLVIWLNDKRLSHIILYDMQLVIRVVIL